MAERLRDLSIFGRKTFFIAPNLAFIPDSYLQTYLSHGYECYAVKADASFPLEQKIKMIISLFPGSLLVFDTTSDVPGVDWKSLIQTTQQVHGSDVVISVIYSKKWTIAEKTHFKNFYNNVAKIEGGCIGLEPGAAKNFERLNRILVKNAACGRRKSVRVPCDESSSLAFSFQGQVYKGHLVDISISHFCGDIDVSGNSIPVFEKISGVSLVVNGMQFFSDAALILRRGDSETARCIFMFIQGKQGSPGLYEELEGKLSPQLYAMETAAYASKLKKAYSAM
ncbi:MAG: hypothetical protein K6G80_06145 [Treponema sp.]|nr:hypothetical protein [Treponema sp.]